MSEAWVQSLFDEEPEVYGPKNEPKVDPRDKVLADGTRYPRGLKGRIVGTDGENRPSWQGNHPGGAPPLDWWNVSEEEVRQRIVLAMCPERVCRTCGEPSRRITEVSYTAQGIPELQHVEAKAGSRRREVDKLQSREQNAQGMTHGRAVKNVTTQGWTDCGHDDWRPGVVLDPFA